MSKGILLYAELTRYSEDGQYVHPVFFELAAKANELSKKLNDIMFTMTKYLYTFIMKP